MHLPQAKSALQSLDTTTYGVHCPPSSRTRETLLAWRMFSGNVYVIVAGSTPDNSLASAPKHTCYCIAFAKQENMIAQVPSPSARCTHKISDTVTNLPTLASHRQSRVSPCNDQYVLISTYSLMCVAVLRSHLCTLDASVMKQVMNDFPTFRKSEPGNTYYSLL